MKKISFGLIALLVSCGTNQTAEGDKFGIGLYKFDDTFISSVRTAMENHNKLGTTVAYLNFADGQSQQPTQNDSIDTFIVEGYDGLGINMVDRTAASVIISKAKQADIPVVFFNREPTVEDMNSWDRLYYIGAKAEESGQIQGEILAKYFKENPSADRNGDGILQYVMLTGEPGHQDAILRTEYSVKALRDAGIRVQQLATDTGMWQRVNGQEKMAAWLSAYGDSIEAVLANNDDMALGAIEALKAQNYFQGDKYIPVIGVDATAPALDSLKDGFLYATVLNDSVGQGSAVIDILKELQKDEPNLNSLPYIFTDERYLWIPYVAVTRDNYQEFR
ncbi:MAG: galactose ABC transporter substrate-binding protein [Brevinema sp.]